MASNVIQVGKYTLRLNNNNTYTAEWRDNEYGSYSVTVSPNEIEEGLTFALTPHWAPLQEAADIFRKVVTDPDAWVETDEGHKFFSLIDQADWPAKALHRHPESLFNWYIDYVLLGYNKMRSTSIQRHQLAPLCRRDFTHFSGMK